MALEPGDDAPLFALPSTSGGTTSLERRIENGPAVVVIIRGYWCSYCAEQLRTFSDLSYLLWKTYDLDILPIVGDPVSDLVEMRDRFDLSIQLLSDENLEIVSGYTGIEDNPQFGKIPIAGTFIVDDEGTIRYSQEAQTPADRTYANYVRHFLASGYTTPYE